ncbi:MAG: OmpA family protein [Alphaproteobacteria bacterium]|nr:OmpA family protein [Alphaproteobacteria bacterium]
MKKQIATIVMSSALLLSGCASWCDECADGSCEVTSKVVLPANALFAFDSSVLTQEGVTALAPVVERMTADKSEKVIVKGYTDSTGPAAYNLGLSNRRAQSVASYLESQGVCATRITTEGYGEDDPVASNETAAGRAQNRRAEVVTYK